MSSMSLLTMREKPQCVWPTLGGLISGAMIGTHERLGHAAVFEATICHAKPQLRRSKTGQKMGIPLIATRGKPLPDMR